MNTKTITSRALSIIDQYLHFKVGPAVCSVPYFNNRTVKARGTLRAYVGKGSPQDIYDEVHALLIKTHIPMDKLTDESLKRLLADQNIGIDCSGFAYYVLNAESRELGRGTIDKHISFVNCHGLLGKMRCALRPVENCDVATLAHDRNSSIVRIQDIIPGDMITMTTIDTGDDQRSGAISPENERNHILIIHQVEYQNSIPVKIHYSHAVAYPEDGVYGTGIKQGTIEITDINKPITESIWIENDQRGELNRIFVRAKKLKTKVRRVK
jgi:hypothetical protein